MPVIAPLVAFSERPGGSPVALKVTESPYGSEADSCSVEETPTEDVWLAGVVRTGGALLKPEISGEGLL